jgi:hypothetical protein
MSEGHFSYQYGQDKVRPVPLSTLWGLELCTLREPGRLWIQQPRSVGTPYPSRIEASHAVVVFPVVCGLILAARSVDLRHCQWRYAYLGCEVGRACTGSTSDRVSMEVEKVTFDVPECPPVRRMGRVVAKAATPVDSPTAL